MSNATWMSDLAKYIEAVPLLNLVLPGTHDSGTYPINRHSHITPYPDSPRFVADIEHIFNDPKYRHWLHLLDVSFHAVVAGWARSQSEDISAQLEAGIRYLDCRVIRDGDQTRICHGMYAEDTDVVIDAVSEFINRNPGEIVILDFNHLYLMTEKSHRDLVGKILRTFGDKLAPSTLTPGVTIGQLWEDGYQVVVIYHCDSDDSACGNVTKGNTHLWPKSSIQSHWPDVAEMGKLKSILADDLKKRLSSHPNQLFVTQGILTEDNDMIEAGLNPFEDSPRTLEELADSVTPKVVGWVENTWNDQPLNIIIVDWFQRADLVGVARSLNRGFENVVDWAVKGQQYNTGSLLAVALNNSAAIVEVHCGSKGTDNATIHYSQAATLQPTGNIRWGASQQYDTGTVLAVAMNDNGDVVEVHCGTDESRYTHYYCVGSFDVGTMTINWGLPTYYDTGSILAVALDNSGTVVDVHCGSPGPHHEHNHYYRVGSLLAPEPLIQWGPYVEYGEGSLLAVAMNNHGTVVEVHCGIDDHQYDLYYRIGTLNASTQTIDWGPSVEYTTGSLPAVAMNDNGYVVEVHCGSSDDHRNRHYCMVGTLVLNAQGQQVIDWSRSQEYETGSVLAVALNNSGYVVELHCGSPGAGNENKHYYSTGQLAVQQTRSPRPALTGSKAGS